MVRVHVRNLQYKRGVCTLVDSMHGCHLNTPEVHLIVDDDNIHYPITSRERGANVSISEDI